MSLVLISSPSFFGHTPPPGHVERPERSDVFDAVADGWRAQNGSVLEPRTATHDEIARVHDPAYIESVEATRGRAVILDPDTFTSPETADLARLAAGGALTALERVLDAPGSRALALVRPPGHHAEAERAMGFCFYNNVAIAAAAALDRGLARVAVVDFDVHHGNGTQHSFERDPRVLFISTHQFPLYPGTGAAHEIGKGSGRGFTMNVPLEAGCTDGDYQQVFSQLVLPALDAFVPELMLVSAGFDAHERDPLAHMRMTSTGFAWLTRALVAVADRHASGRLVAVTEGGYELTALGESLIAVVRVLADETAWIEDGALGRATGRAERAVSEVRAAQAARRPGL